MGQGCRQYENDPISKWMSDLPKSHKINELSSGQRGVKRTLSVY